jgi:hypothetical protein
MSRSRCVVSLATHGRFTEGLRRLEQSLADTGFTGGLVCWRPGEFPPGCPSHLEVPFAFKPYCIADAGRQGFDAVLWLDSSCVVLRPLDALFEQIERDGYVLFRNRSYRVGQWSSDRALDVLGLNREQAMDIAEVNAAAIGLNLRHPLALEFLERWLEAAKGEVAFRGIDEPLETHADYQAVKWNREGRVSPDPRVRGHRHDQTVAGVLAYRLGLQLTTEGLQVAGDDAWPRRRRTVILLDRRGGSPLARRVKLGLRGALSGPRWHARRSPPS